MRGACQTPGPQPDAPSPGEPQAPGALVPRRAHRHRPPRPSGVRRDLLAILALIASCLAACDPPLANLEMALVEVPSGGAVTTLALIEGGAGSEAGPGSWLIAPTRNHIYRRSADAANPWQANTLASPTPGQFSGQLVLESLQERSDGFNFPKSQHFAAHAGRLWVIARPASHAAPMLLSSADRGESWVRMDLPEALEPSAGPESGEVIPAPDTPRGLRNGQHTGQHTVRLLARPQGLYLTDGRQLWRHKPARDQASHERPWHPINLDGILPLEPRARQDLVATIRHYLPPATHRPYELLTVFDEQLMVYRRHTPAQDQKEPDPQAPVWLLVATLPSVDLALLDSPATGATYLLAPDAILRAEDDGEHWQTLTPEALEGMMPQFTTLQLVDWHKAPGKHVLLAATALGSVHRSLDAGLQWEQVRPPDADARAVTAIVHDPIKGFFWLATEGSGVLLSRDMGQSWQAANEGLQAARPLAMTLTPSGELLLGTDAGLFRHSARLWQGDWSPIHDRATSAVTILPGDGRILSGTAGGEIVLTSPDGRHTVVGLAHPPDAQPLLFAPAWLQELALTPTAIVALEAQPDHGPLYAATYQYGIQQSPDQGASWAPLPLNPGFRQALQGSILTSLVAGPGEHLYLTSQPLEPQRLSHLWHSPNGGQSWRAAVDLAQPPSADLLQVTREQKTAAPGLFLSHSHGVMTSDATAGRWTELSGPWQEDGHRMLSADFAHSPGHITTVSTLATSIVSMQGPANISERPSIAMVWPERQGPRPERNLLVRIHDRHVMATDYRRLYAGAMPRRTSQLSDSLAVIVTLASLLVLTMGSFAWLRGRAR